MSEELNGNYFTGSEIRCSKCKKLLAKWKEGQHGYFEIKCPRCRVLNTILEHMISQVIVTNPEGIILYINKATEIATGYFAHEAIGKKIGDLWGKQMPEAFYKELWHTIKDERKTFTGKMTNKRKTGELYDVQLVVSPILNHEEGVIFYVGIEALMSNPP